MHNKHSIPKGFPYHTSKHGTDNTPEKARRQKEANDKAWLLSGIAAGVKNPTTSVLSDKENKK